MDPTQFTTQMTCLKPQHPNPHSQNRSLGKTLNIMDCSSASNFYSAALTALILIFISSSDCDNMFDFDFDSDWFFGFDNISKEDRS